MSDVSSIVRAIRIAIGPYVVPIVTKVALHRDPYQVLISCILSLRTQDKTTAAACSRLFSVARTPHAMLRISPLRLSRIIYPVGFYRTKARTIHDISRRLLQEHNGKTPSRIEDLLSLKGVGRKTANLVLGLGFGIPAICVDTHVHRISNRLGWVRTRSPEETEQALARFLPRRYWIQINTLLVTFGQNICQPVSPFCSRCPVRSSCKRAGVTRSR